MNLIKYPNKLLDTKLDEIDLENLDFDPKELKDQMTNFMLENDGIGLAANQVGLNKRLFVMTDRAKTESILCMNPTILQHTAAATEELEGCLSFPNMWVKVKRPSEVLVHFYDEDLVEQIFKMDGHNARVYLHEMDHTLGITFKDRVSGTRWDMAKRKAKKFQKLTQAA